MQEQAKGVKTRSFHHKKKKKVFHIAAFRLYAGKENNGEEEMQVFLKVFIMTMKKGLASLFLEPKIPDC